jgi:glycosyltransferase involved in cell wall biosynthesis
MGRDVGCVSQYRTLCTDLIHVEHVNAPTHLQLTSWASLGIVGYNHDSLNNLYCAPNKIYEYGSFGIPILANDVPGLTATVERYSAGVCAKSDEDEVRRGLDRIECQYEVFSAGSRQLYDEALRIALPNGASQVLDRLN